MFLDKNKYIEHINDSDQILTMRKILDKVERTLKNHAAQHTDFLDPYQRRLSYSFLNRIQDINFDEEGGYKEAERKTIDIYPSYKSKHDIDSAISAVRVDGSFKFSDLNHRDYLGAILSLGIKREKIGDILIHDDYGQIVLHKEIIDYIIYNFKNIGKEPIKLKEISIHEVSKGIEKYREIAATISSLRLDAVLSSACNVPRAKSSSLIRSLHVKVNWQPINQPSYEVYEGDVISAKGFGRIILHKVMGISKKGRIKIIIRILK